MARDLSMIAGGNRSTEEEVSRRSTPSEKKRSRFTEEVDEDEDEDEESEEDDDEEEEPEEKPKAKKSKDEIEIEIVDEPKRWKKDPAENLKSKDSLELKGKFKKRVDELTATASELARQRDAEAKKSQELTQYARGIQQQNREYQEMLLNGGYGTIESQIKASEAEAELASQQYKLAAAAQDADSMGNAQRKLSTASARIEFLKPKLEEIEQGRQELTARQKKEKEKEDREAAEAALSATEFQKNATKTKEQQQASIPVERAAWFRKNSWFSLTGSDPMSQYAKFVHSQLEASGDVDLDSTEYFDAIDEAMEQKYPDFFNKGQSRSAAVGSRRTPVRDSVIRGNKVYLTKTQHSTAKSLGLTTPAQLKAYAIEIARLKD